MHHNALFDTSKNEPFDTTEKTPFDTGNCIRRYGEKI